MVIKYTSVIKFFIILILLSNVMFLSVPGISSMLLPICSFSTKKLVIFLILILTVFVFYKGIPVNTFKGISSKIAIIYVVMYTCTMLYSILNYPTVSFQTIVSHYYFSTAILFYFALKKFMKNDDFYYWFVNAIIILGLIYSLYMILSKVIYEATSHYIFDTFVQNVQSRNQSLRLARPANYICISSIFAFCMFLKNIKNQSRTAKKYFIIFLIGLFCIFYVTQTRIYEIAFFICFFIGLMCFYEGNKKFFLIILALLSIPILIPIAQKFYQSFYTTENIWGTEIRFSGYIYYISHMFDGVLWGIGTVWNSSYSYLITGNSGYVLSDMGYAGFLGIFGISGVLLLSGIVYLFILTYKKLKKQKLIKNNPECIIFPVFFIIINLSLSFTDAQRCMYLPIFLLAYVHMEYKLNEKQEV